MDSRPALPNLTTVRLLAALYVFIFHFVKGLPYLSLGNTGVSLFFVLSGFILAYNHPTVPDRRRFFAFRLARIYPLYAVSLLAGLPQFLHTHQDGPAWVYFAVPACFALIQTWIPPIRSALNPVGWTLPVEVFFYACFPFLVGKVADHLAHWKWWVALLAVLLLVPTTLMFFLVIPRVPAQAYLLKELLNLPIFHLGEFVMGMFFGLRFLSVRPRFTGTHVLLSFLLLAGCTALARQIPWFYLELILDGLLAVPYALLVYVLAGWRSRWFGHPLLQLGGEISYGVYLLQFQVGLVLSRVLRNTDAVFGPVLLVLTLAAAYTCYVWIERPARSRMLRAFGYHPTPKPTRAPAVLT